MNCYHHWNSTTLNLFISELLVTSESVEHQTIFQALMLLIHKSTDNMSSVNEETPEQHATHEEELRTATSEDVYPQRALVFLIILIFTCLVILLIIGLIGLKWINQTQNKCGYHCHIVFL